MNGRTDETRVNLSALFWFVIFLTSLCLPPAHAQAQNETTWAVTIVLPPKLVAGKPVTLATLGLDGKLAPHIAVDLSTGDKVETDATGRAVFTAPKNGMVLIARAAGASAAALIDAADPNSESSPIAVAAMLSLRDSFSICGRGFQGEAEKNRVLIGGDPALVIASSPECIEVVAGPKTPAGATTLSATTSAGPKSVAITFISFAFETPRPPLTTGAKSWLRLTVAGSDKRVSALVTNETPGVIQFDKGDVQEVTSSGGSQNTGQIRVEALRSGDFSFRARLLPAPDLPLAHQFLASAQPLAPPELRRSLKKLSADLERHPKNLPRVRVQLQQIVSTTMTGDLRTVLEAAYFAL